MIKLTIIVTHVDVYIGMGFTHACVYTSIEESGTYTSLVDILLVAGVTEYSYSHTAGTSDTWYRSSICDPATEDECCWSDPVKGVSPALFHYATYPVECEYEADDLVIIRKIRRFIGDFEGLKRLYIDEAEFCNYVQDDNKTIDLSERSWPVYISLNNVEKTSLLDPIVQGYQHLTFSGTLDESSDTLDIWYYTFKFSDREIYEAFGDTLIPPGLTSSTVTQDHLVLQAAIDLLENMVVEDSVEDGAVVRDDRSLYDPSPGLLERDKTIKRLKTMLDALVRQCMFSNLGGVLID